MPSAFSLMTKLFELLDARHIKPINPIHIFSFGEVASAVRFLRAGKHIGKVVISNGPEPKVSAPVSSILQINGYEYTQLFRPGPMRP